MRKIELLAPAGGIKQYIAAVENGADAVYLGGTLYNARISAANFTLEEMEKAVDYGHLRGVKTYVTVNTLLTDDELPKALEYAKKLYKIGVDALIIQDMGLGKLVHETMPDFPIHASTQATVYNKTGVEEMKKLGFSRVVLARELSLEEIKAATGILDIEVFIHGALCFCYSGQCQLSRAIGGRSGNKGGCAQPCRLPYRSGEGEYPLSPKDLNMIDHIGDLIEAGVTSFKIEGRMKSPEYVATVTRIYRKYIDEYLKNGRYKVSQEDRLDLLQIFNRGGFTDGYAVKDPKGELLSGLMPKNQGVFIGTIEAPVKNGVLADIRAIAPLEMGDVIEVHSALGFTTKVTYFEKLKNGSIRIGDMKEKVANGDKIFKIVSDDLMKRASTTFADIEFDQGKFIRKQAVDLVLLAKLGEELKLTANIIYEGKRFSVISVLPDFTVEGAKSRGTTEEDIKKQLSKTGGTPFELGHAKLITDGDVYIPQSKLNELRRITLDSLKNEVVNAYKRDFDYERQLNEEQLKDEAKGRFEIRFECFDDFEKADMAGIIKEACAAGYDKERIFILLPIRDVVQDMLLIKSLAEPLQIGVIPYLGNVTKGSDDKWLGENEETIAKLIKAFGGSVYIGNIGQAELFKQYGFDLLADFGLNIYNKESLSAYNSLGIGKGVDSLETLDNGYGNFPLMITEHEMPYDELIDRKGAKYSVRFDRAAHKSVIKSKEMSIDWDKLKEMSGLNNNVRIYI